ncbi:MAG: hypothetical protein AAGD38_09605 [Acidobacteriota bacterium]
MTSTPSPTTGTAFWIELAFDWDAGPHPTLDQHLLQIGLARTGSLTEPASFGGSLQTGDTLAFMLFDNTSDSSGGGNPPYRILQNIEILFSPTRDDQGATSPFGITTGLAVRPRSGAGPRLDSTMFGSSLPAWPLFNTDPDANEPAPFRLDNPGRYFLTVHVTMSNGNERRSFRVDPEMIVNSTGSGGPTIDPDA